MGINLTSDNYMKTLSDCFGREVRVTDERLAHILERPELGGMDSEVEVVLRQPRFVRLSRSDPGVRLFYSFYRKHWLVINGYVSWLNTKKLTPLL